MSATPRGRLVGMRWTSTSLVQTGPSTGRSTSIRRRVECLIFQLRKRFRRSQHLCDQRPPSRPRWRASKSAVQRAYRLAPHFVHTPGSIDHGIPIIGEDDPGEDMRDFRH